MIEDVLSLCADLVKCKSVTPADDGALERVADYLAAAGFETKLLTFTSPDGKNSIKNLFAQYGKSDKKILGFVGHSDVVPAGELWEVEPFGGVLKDGFLYGRGVCDMKGGIAAFCAAVTDFVKQLEAEKNAAGNAADAKNPDQNNQNNPNNQHNPINFDGSIVVMITGDEEVGSREGIQSLIDWCREHRKLPHDCLLGEPSSYREIGDRIYIGHRGSLNILAKSKGKQGHVAYQGNYDNSLAKICRYVAKMLKYEWKYTDTRFPRTNIEPTMLFTGNYATNVVPEESSVNLNIRYGADYKLNDLESICREQAAEFGISLEFHPSGDAYCCDDERLKTMIAESIKEVAKLKAKSYQEPEFSCAGGTSDGRFMSKFCNVIEFGLQDANIHQKNERAKVEDLMTLSTIYNVFIKKYFAS